MVSIEGVDQKKGCNWKREELEESDRYKQYKYQK